VHSVIGKTPFELDLGYTPRALLDIAVQAKMGHTRTCTNDSLFFVEQIEDNLRAVKNSLANAQNKQKLLAIHTR
jgi:hypothetical protein